MVKYYPEEISIARLIREFREIGWVNHAEEQRFQDIADRKARGKGAPKKVKEKGESRRADRKRKVSAKAR